MSKEDKENAFRCTSKNGTRRKKWDINPDFPVVLPRSSCDNLDVNNEFGYAGSVSTTTKASSTFIIYKGDSISTAEEDKIKLQSKYKNEISNGHAPVSNITNSVAVAKQNEKKEIKRSLQVVTKATVEKEKVQQKIPNARRSTTKSRPAGLPQRRLTLKKPVVKQVQQRGMMV